MPYNAGDFIGTETVMIPFNAFSSNDPAASITVTDLANTDVVVFKDASLSQRTSSSGIAVDIDVDTHVGMHWITLDLSDNDDAGFYVAGSQYIVGMVGVTADAGTVTAWVGGFTIGKAAAVVTAALVAHNLDHLALTATAAADMTTEVADNTILSRMLANGDTSAFVPSTDGMQPIRDHIGDGTNLTEAGGDGDQLTESGGTGDQLTAINLPNQTMNITGDITGNLSGSVGTLTGHTAQSGDGYAVVNHADHGNAKLVRSTTPANKLDVSATGEAGLDFANIKDATGAHTLTNITVPVVTTNTDMKGTDSAVLATTIGSAVGADISADIAAIPTTMVGTNNAALASVLGSAVGADISADIAAIPTTMVGTNNAATAAVLGSAVGASISADIAAISLVIPDAAGTAAVPGDLMGLANDAITAAKFDESTAFPVVATDTGVTQIARVGADGDTLETLSDEIATAQTDLDTLTDARGEPAQGTPPASNTTNGKVDVIYKQLINPQDSDGTTEQLYNNAGAVVDQKRTVSSAGGTVTKAKVVSGP